jgi:hypothetical protein
LARYLFAQMVASQNPTPGLISRREARRGVLVSLDIDKALFVGEVAVLVPLKDEIDERIESAHHACGGGRRRRSEPDSPPAGASAQGALWDSRNWTVARTLPLRTSGKRSLTMRDSCFSDASAEK